MNTRLPHELDDSDDDEGISVADLLGFDITESAFKFEEKEKAKATKPVPIKEKAEATEPVLIKEKAKFTEPVPIKEKAKSIEPGLIKEKAKATESGLIKEKAKSTKPVLMDPATFTEQWRDWIRQDRKEHMTHSVAEEGTWEPLETQEPQKSGLGDEERLLYEKWRDEVVEQKRRRLKRGAGRRKEKNGIENLSVDSLSTSLYENMTFKRNQGNYDWFDTGVRWQRKYLKMGVPVYRIRPATKSIRAKPPLYYQYRIDHERRKLEEKKDDSATVPIHHRCVRVSSVDIVKVNSSLILCGSTNGAVQLLRVNAEKALDVRQALTFDRAGLNESSLLAHGSAGENYIIQEFRGHDRPIRKVVSARDMGRFVCISFDGFTTVWDIEHGKCEFSVKTPRLPTTVEFVPGKEHEILIGCEDGRLYGYDTRKPPEEYLQCYDQHLEGINDLMFLNDVETASIDGTGGRFVTTSRDKSIRLWSYGINVTEHSLEASVAYHASALALHPSHKFFVSLHLNNMLCSYECRDGMKKYLRNTFRNVYTNSAISRPGFSCDGKYLSCGEASGNVKIWDWETRGTVLSWRAHNGLCVQTTWAPWGGLISGSTEGTLCVWLP